MQSDTSCRRLNVSTFTYWSLINLIDLSYYSCIDSINKRVRSIWLFKVKIMFVDLTEDEQTTGSRHIRSGSGPLPVVESRVREIAPRWARVQVFVDELDMLKVFQVSLRRAMRSCVCFPACRVPAAGRAGSVLGSEAAAGRCLTRQLCSRVRSCKVDPNLEEKFVFVDCTGET